MSVVLALLSSVMWGTADFLGGTLARRIPTFVVVAWSQFAGLLVVLVVMVFSNGWTHIPEVWLPGLLAGLTGYAGLLMFYRGLSIGTMGVVAPITALGVLVPLGVGLVRGDVPTAIQSVGVVTALVGVVLASGPEIRGACGPTPVILAVLAGGCFGTALTLIAVGSETDTVATMVVMRGGTVVVAFALVAALRLPVRASRRQAGLLGVAGAFDVGANLTFGIATTLGLLSIVSVAGSLYPVATVVLAAVVLKERLKRIQQVGVALAIVSVAIIAAG